MLMTEVMQHYAQRARIAMLFRLKWVRSGPRADGERGVPRPPPVPLRPPLRTPLAERKER